MVRRGGTQQKGPPAKRSREDLLETSSSEGESEECLAQQEGPSQNATARANIRETRTGSSRRRVEESEERPAQRESPSGKNTPAKRMRKTLPETSLPRREESEELVAQRAGPSRNGSPTKRVHGNLPEEPERRQAKVDDITGSSQRRRSRDVPESPRQASSYNVQLKQLDDKLEENKKIKVDRFQTQSNALDQWFATHPAEDPLIIHLKNVERIELDHSLLTSIQALTSEHERRVAELDRDFEKLSKEQYAKKALDIASAYDLQQEEQVLKRTYAKKRAALDLELQSKKIRDEVYQARLIDLDAEERDEDRKIKPRLEEERKRLSKQKEEERKRQFKQEEEERKRQCA